MLGLRKFQDGLPAKEIRFKGCGGQMQRIPALTMAQNRPWIKVSKMQL